MDEAGAGEPDADESGDEMRETNAVGRLEHVEVLQHVWNGHQTKTASEPQPCHTHTHTHTHSLTRLLFTFTHCRIDTERRAVPLYIQSHHNQLHLHYVLPLKRSLYNCYKANVCQYCCMVLKHVL